MIGIIGAMQIEIEGIKKLMTDVRELKTAGITIFTGTISGKKVALAESGIGKVFAAVAATAMLTAFPEISEVINLGVAGGVKKQGDIIIGSKCVQHDYSGDADGLKPGVVTGYDSAYFACDSGMIALMQKAVGEKDCYTGTIASGDQFICDEGKLNWIATTFSALAVDMESAAIAHVCDIFQKKYLALRTLSDGAGENAVSDFWEFVGKAAQRSTAAVLKYIELNDNI